MTITSSRGSYDVQFSSLQESFDAIGDCFVITDENVAALYGSVLNSSNSIIVPPGEASKSVDRFGLCLEELARKGGLRNSVLVAFGGGVVGDLAGFVASAYMRGLKYYQVPSTLMAQVDSSIGGKVGVDLAEGKNLAGAFYPPAGVFICPELLRTLNDRQFNNGMAEVWKYAFITDTSLGDELGDSPISATHPRIGEVLRKCVQVKADIVCEDEFETSGRRAILNFGHTVGHAIEKATGYSRFLHGEAISMGMVCEARMGERLEITAKGTAKEIQRALERQNLPVELPGDLDPVAMLDSMLLDKKRRTPGLSFSLLKRLGQCKLVEGLAESDVERAVFLS